MQNKMSNKKMLARKSAEAAIARMAGMQPGGGTPDMIGTAVERMPQDNVVQAPGLSGLRAMLAQGAMPTQQPSAAAAVPPTEQMPNMDEELMRLIMMRRRQQRGM